MRVYFAVGKTGKVKESDLGWGPSKKILLGDIKGYIENLKHVKTVVDESTFPEINRQEIQKFLDMQSVRLSERHALFF